jgi:hypothetical protein
MSGRPPVEGREMSGRLKLGRSKPGLVEGLVLGDDGLVVGRVDGLNPPLGRLI